jgi:hypothetical protein
MNARFAKGTQVSVAKSRAEIEHMLTRYGATSFASGWEADSAVIMFEAKGRRIRFTLPLPDANAKLFAVDGNGRSRSPSAREEACDAERRRRWRALALVIKAKLEAVESGIAAFEEEFLANIVVPGGRTFGEWARPQIARAYDEGLALPPLLSAGGPS